MDSEDIKDLTVNEFCKKCGWKRRGDYYDLVESICRAYDLDQDAFVKSDDSQLDYIKDDHAHRFKKEWNDLAYVLFSMYTENPYKNLNSTENSATTEDVLTYYKKYIKKIDELSDFHRKNVQLSNEYQATLLEITHLGLAQKKFQLLFTMAEKFPIELRSALWIDLIKLIDKLAVSYNYYNLLVKKNIECEKVPYNKQLVGDLECGSLDQLLAKMLKNEMDHDVLLDRESLINEYNEAVNELDEIFMANDPPEFQQLVNKFFEENNIEAKLQEAGNPLAEMTIERIKRSATTVKAPTIDEIVQEAIISNNNNGKPLDEDKLRLAGELVKAQMEEGQENEKNKKLAEDALKTISFSVNKREKLKRVSKGKKK